MDLNKYFFLLALQKWSNRLIISYASFFQMYCTMSFLDPRLLFHCLWKVLYVHIFPWLISLFVFTSHNLTVNRCLYQTQYNLITNYKCKLGELWFFVFWCSFTETKFYNVHHLPDECTCSAVFRG